MKLFKVPYRILPYLIKDTIFLRAYCIYGKLKIMCGKKGLFFNYKHRKQELADTLGIAYNTLCKYVRKLKEYDLVWESNNNLRLAESYKIYDAFNLVPNVNDDTRSKRYGQISTKQFRLTFDELNEDRLVTLACKLKKEQITYKQIESLRNSIIEGYGNIHSENARKKINKSANKRASEIYSSLADNTRYNFLSIEKEHGFLDNNMSLQSYASFFGKKSKMAAHRRMKKYEKLGLCEITKRAIKFCDKKDFNLKAALAVYGKGWRLSETSAYCLVPSKITFK